MEKITVSEFKQKVYDEFKEEINAIVKASEKEDFKADIGVATDMFLTNIEENGNYPYVNEEKAKARIAELRTLIGE